MGIKAKTAEDAERTSEHECIQQYEQYYTIHYQLPVECRTAMHGAAHPILKFYTILY